VYRDCALFLAACSQEKYRNGTRALQLARKGCALTFEKDGGCLDALAAACAELGQFEEAVSRQRQALADPAFERRHGQDARARLRLYEEGKPFRLP
jgi:serine/threonine-protein kinase